MDRFCLSIHTAYACAHSGACCASGWPIPVEAPLESAVLRNLVPVSGPAFAAGGGSDGRRVQILATTQAGACVFFEPEQGRLCAIHRTMGPGLLPAACRNFPRIALRDPRGVFVTLSHYCPTAARMLLDDHDMAIVEAPASLTLDGAVEGLDATAVMPPLLRPGMLMNLEGYTAWEHAAITTLNDPALEARAAVRVIEAATAVATRWRPGGESLSAWIEMAFANARTAPAAHRDDAAFAPFEQAAKRFVAAHAFASWSAYQDGGLPAVARSVRSALERLHSLIVRARTDGDRLEVAFIAAVRQADFQLRHTVADASPRSLSALRRD
jgi:Fe-S-cluster containining protein